MNHFLVPSLAHLPPLHSLLSSKERTSMKNIQACSGVTQLFNFLFLCLQPALEVLSFCVDLWLQVYQDLCKKHPTFRERSEKVDLAVEISLQPWEAFRCAVRRALILQSHLINNERYLFCIP